MPKYKDSPEVRAAKKERKEKLREFLQLLDVEDYSDLRSIFKEMVGEVLENGLEAELDDELGYSKYDYRNKDTENSRNGYSRKSVKTSAGPVEIAVPHDRNGDFEPQIIKKNETSLTGDIEEKIISMYAKGMTTNDISYHIQDIYGIDVSDSLIRSTLLFIPFFLPVGNLICDAGLAMHKDDKTKDNGRTRQKFCCPYKNSKTNDCPCNHKNWNNGKKNRGCTKYITIPDDYRLSIDRTSIQFKSVYSLRTEAERYNSRFKSTGQERLWVRNGYSAKNLNTVAHIALLAIALAAVITKSDSSYRSFKNCKRTA